MGWSWDLEARYERMDILHMFQTRLQSILGRRADGLALFVEKEEEEEGKEEEEAQGGGMEGGDMLFVERADARRVYIGAEHRNTLQHTATCCNMLQQLQKEQTQDEFTLGWSTVTHCNTLQYTATCCNTLQQLQKEQTQDECTSG